MTRLNNGCNEPKHNICRWDNAPHHPEFPTFPHRIHGGEDACVLPHEAMDVAKVLEKIETILALS